MTPLPGETRSPGTLLRPFRVVVGQPAWKRSRTSAAHRTRHARSSQAAIPHNAGVLAQLRLALRRIDGPRIVVIASTRDLRGARLCRPCHPSCSCGRARGAGPLEGSCCTARR
jgi:hypothetical protein